MTSSSAPVVLLALDACDAGLLQELAAAGVCPNVAALLHDGAIADTIAPYGTFVGSSWMTISTGAEVGSHRYWNWLEVDPETYELCPTTPRASRRRPFWQHLDAAGALVAVLDVPHADALEGFGGVLLKEWGCHDRHHGTASVPPSFLEHLDATVGRHYGGLPHPGGSDAFAPCDYTLRAGAVRTPGEEHQLRDLLLQGVAQKRRASVALLADGGWDVFVSVHGEGHCVGHQLWHVHDPSHPRHDPEVAALLGDPLVDVYRALDASIGAHRAEAGPDATFMLLCNHGMGPHYDGDHLLDEVLTRIDPALNGPRRPGRATQLAGALLERAPASLRSPARAAVAGLVRRRAASAPPPPSHPSGPGPARSFFAIPGNTTVGAIRFNLQGREAQGLVAPADLPALRAAVADSLLGLIDVATGRPAVAAVVVSDDVLERAPHDRLPDLFVEWERDHLLDTVWSPEVGTVTAPYEHWRTGDHNDRGLVVVAGPGIAAGRRAEPLALTDIAPTVCALAGAALPGADGRPRVDLLPAAAVPALPAAASAPRRPLRGLARRPVAGPDGGGGADRHRLLLDLAHRVRALEVAREDAQQEHGAALAALHVVAQRVEELERTDAVWAATAWLGQQAVMEESLVSVILPTHDRPDQLRRAIASVEAQRYPHWELVVVDDGCETGAPVVAAVADPRITYRAVPHGGVCAARNIGLDLATGEIITYLDDDNTLDPGWLHAVAWAFAHHPEHDTLYGARVIDDRDRVHGRPPSGLPMVQFSPYDRAGLEMGNFADIGVLAHRAGAAGARFDESLWECGDWDFFLALTEHQPPLELPMVALHYHTDSKDRLTGRFPDHEQIVREKWARRRATRDDEGSPAG
jgi:predicted AlkP superfamily phosphohydrolase/phosphomutase